MTVGDLRQIVALSDHQIAQLDSYLATLRRWNQRISLVSARELPRVVDRHLADCLQAVQICRDAKSLLDVGTGAGLPGIPIAIALPELSVTLVDSARKKISFLTDAIHAAGIQNARPLESRVEALPHEHDRTYDVIITRAFVSLGKFLPSVLRLRRPGGKIIMMKGPRYAAEIDLQLLQSLGLSTAPVIEYKLADGSDRVLLTVR